jgi:hypothetical protein
MHFYDDGDDDAKDQKQQQKQDHIAGAEAGDYSLPDDVGTRVGEAKGIEDKNL